MIERRSVRRWAWLALFVYLYTAIVPISGLVLCVEPDGRVSLEIATSSASCSDCGPQAAPIDRCCTDPDGLGPADCACSDYVLATGLARHGRNRAPGAERLAAVAAVLAETAITGAPPILDRRELRARPHSPPGLRPATNPILRV